MENKETKDYKEERFEFSIFVNNNLICKRNFRIYNFVEGSMQTLEFKEKVDEIVDMIDSDLKSKSRVYTWHYYNPDYPEDNEELVSPLIEPWSCTFKIVITDNKKEVISKIWDGYAYPKFIRERVDLGNKNVKITNKDGQTFLYEKEAFFKANEGRLSFELETIKGMIMDKQDVLLQITKKICEACSPAKDEIKSINPKGHFEFKDNSKYLENYTVVDDYGNDEQTEKHLGGHVDSNTYAYNLQLANAALVKSWDDALREKTKKYFKELY